MGDKNFLSEVRSFIGYVAFKIFLWSIEMSLEEYINQIYIEESLMKGNSNE